MILFEFITGMKKKISIIGPESKTRIQHNDFHNKGFIFDLCTTTFIRLPLHQLTLLQDL